MASVDDLYDPSAYVFGFPLWLIRNGAIMADETAHPFSALAKGTASFSDGTEDREYLAFFTDEDLAERFIRDNDLELCHVDEVHKELFLGLLREAQQFGIHYVGLDAGSRQGRIVPIERFISGPR